MYAALGEMSAAVSHELNQPLAAMKTYLAGARLLLQRKRPDEALSSFQRIDDLIERMGAITRQLKSYARKGGEAFEEVDLRACVSSALAMMEPQLKARVVKISRTMPRQPVMVLADRIRLEQVIINLLRNALDATKDVKAPAIDLLVSAGETATLLVRDNGHGIVDLENLFEPFYTTKKPGEGVGLGLAISSGIVTDLGGRLTARNLEPPEGPGAEFEMQLKTRVVRITRSLPRQPVMVMADRIRLEQVIINLLRNALDATKDVASPQIDLLLSAGETATLTVRDNGHGIGDLENLFEPFYTTKKPGEGVGLGLAISSGIVTDLGGRLTARNAEGGGAVFEMQLPILGNRQEAAE